MEREQIGKDGYTSDIWNPGSINNELDKMVFVKNKGTYDAYVRTVFAFEAGNYETLDQFNAKMHLNLNDTDWTWAWLEEPVAIGESTYFVATATYNKALEPGKLTEISLSQIALDKSATNADVEAFGDTYQILVKSQAIQADGFDDPAAALDDGFGFIDADSLPWDTDAATKGGVLKDALHHDPEGNPITTSVTAIVFGKKADYPEIVNNNKGYLVDVDQDVGAHVYYVTGKAKAADYTVYVLSNDTVYAPKDSTGLFQGMTNVKTIDARNLNMSRVENTTFMFRDCSKLQELDATGWDTSNVTNMMAMFYQNYALSELDVSGWNVENVKNASYLFGNCSNLVSVDTTGWNLKNADTAYAMFMNDSKLTQVIGSGNWDLSKVTNAQWMFQNCGALTSIDVTEWSLSSLEQAGGMFLNCGALTAVEGSGNWNLSKLIDAQWMFQNNAVLTYVDATKWGLDSCTRVDCMFMGCNALETVEGTENWNTGNIENMYGMFYYNHKLKDLDVSTWDTGKVTNMYYMFGRCYELEELEVTNWDVRNVTDFSYMFKAPGNSGSMKLKKFDVSKWQPNSAVTMLCMFYGCGQLTQMDLSGWDMPNLINAGHMFADCYKLEKVDFTDWNTPSLLTIDAMFNDCHALKTVDMSDIDTANLKELSQVFEACYSLEKVIGMDQWDTSNVCTYTEMFSGCSSLKELDLSGFNTGSAYDNYYDMNNSYSSAFGSMLANVKSLEKLIVSDKINYYGNGTVPESNKMVFPNPAAKEGFTAKWQNVETEQTYLGKDIPAGVAATYVAYYEPIPTT